MVEEESDIKLRELVELNTTAAKEYEEAMLKRVEYFAKKNAEKSIFNNFIQNTVVKGFSTILDLKVKFDESLGEKNLTKVRDVFEKILMFGL
jgi:hypothetical protein